MSAHHDQSEYPALVWAALYSPPKKHTQFQLVGIAGIGRAQVLSTISAFRNAGLVIDFPDGSFSPAATITPLLFARAIEMGVPLSVLETTVELSIPVKKEAFKIASSGTLEKDHKKQRKVLEKKRNEHIRGRAATRAAATDLARLINDTSSALGDSVSSEIHLAIKKEAEKALETLIQALEKK